MELDELHVEQIGAGIVGQRVTVARVLPAVARDLERAPDAARCEHNRLGPKELETTALAVVRKGASDSVAVLQQPNHRALHVHVDTLMDPVILKRPDQFETGPIADVRQARIAMAAEVALEDLAVLRAIEERAPGLEFAHAVWRFFRVQFCHAPVVDVLAAAHGVRKVDLPAVAVVHIAERGSDAAFGHHGVCLAEKRFADKTDRHTGRRSLDGRPQSCAACSDDKNVVVVSLVFSH